MFYAFYCYWSTYLASYDVNPVSEKEVSAPEEIDKGGAGDVCKYLHHHRDDEEKNLKIFHSYLLKATGTSPTHLFPITCGGTPSLRSYFPPHCPQEYREWWSG